MAFVQNNLLNLIPVICHLSKFQKTGRPPNRELLLHLDWKSSQWLTQLKLTLRPLYKPSRTPPQLFPQEEPSRTTKCITWTTAHFVYMWCFHGDVIWVMSNPCDHGNRGEEAVQCRMMGVSSRLAELRFQSRLSPVWSNQSKQSAGSYCYLAHISPHELGGPSPHWRQHLLHAPTSV